MWRNKNLEDLKKDSLIISELEDFLTNHPFAALNYLKDTFPWTDPIYLLSEWVCLTRKRINFPLIFTEFNLFQKMKSLFHSNNISSGSQLKNFINEKIEICKNEHYTHLLSKFRHLKVLITPRLNDLNFLFLLNKLKDCWEKKNFTESEKCLNEANEIYSNSEFTPNFKLSNPFNFNEIKIQNILMDFANKYPRILISEIVKRSKLETFTVESIVKKLISSGQIKAIFDDESRGLEFQFAMDEIDQLMKTYQNWEGKKNNGK
jgi:hypothetical protein